MNAVLKKMEVGYFLFFKVGPRQGNQHILQKRRGGGDPGSLSARGARKPGLWATLVGRPPEAVGRGLEPKWLRQVGLRPLGARLFWGFFRFLLDVSGPYWGLSEVLGGLSGASWGPLGFSSGPLGPKSSDCQCVFPFLGRSWDFLDPSWRPLCSCWPRRGPS